MTSVEITPVKDRAGIRAFIDLPWRIYADDPNWVPPLKRDVRRMLNTHRHPFWEFSECALFLARRGTEVVGRIAGIVDHNHNHHHAEEAAAWGFFDCVNEQEAASALFAAVEEWGYSKGMRFLRGPLNPSLNYEAGALIQGFGYPPTVMMTYNPRYYIALIEAFGFEKEKDLLSFWVDRNLKIPEWVMPLAERLRNKDGLVIRTGQIKNFQQEQALIRQIYTESWSGNWGFVAPTEKEAAEMGRYLKRIIDPDLVFFLYHGEEPVGVGFALPDWNPVLKRLDGKLGLSGLLKIRKYRKCINGLRGFMFGIKEGYRQLGFPIVAFAHMSQVLRQKSTYHYMELGWLLEDNQAFNQFFHEGGLEVFKRYRIYRKDR
jgi:hypothetical protein